MRVLAALSGGVDSAVAAARAVDAGHDVIGVHMALSRNRDQYRSGSRGCCSIEDSNDARRAADKLGIPYYVWDLSDEFHDLVVNDFLNEYAAGRTPNPCVRCNEHIKFDTLLERAQSLGFDAVATGHYARVVIRDDGVRELHRAVDAAKDQSYVLAVMGPEKLARAMFPLGEIASKSEVRAEAAARGLGVSNKPDSYDICFVADGDTKGFLERALGEKPGEIVDEAGEVVGAHSGAYSYTVGQRKGLRLPRPAADGAPRYVTGIDTDRNIVTVGPESLLSVRELVGEQAVWLAPDASAVAPTPCLAQVRAHGEPVPGSVVRAGDRLTVSLDQPMRGVAAGQSLVVYDGTRVLGQATIAKRAVEE
ncbi:tRNA 2-thiouridine(34) synthase MnmA [Demequina sp. TTPB684]|uniref:tRNA 2-thiouridine(34) synthase MnmA n=1 Tax=unclassified Demequina TaxID=2620311 RepID=UPI001CF184A5|nr:tRNA 2-thiouridine(34) synthase MnmA [Demequina sp. TMPB413]MCB2413977.1 tRNA 2-thiouridine(34) synthase MnmA [Demequina sp. TTPB684]UPU88670.1 tRNA 2-thiouridine(34) synthase MnmA [Demequina sp. TMPB413]